MHNSLRLSDSELLSECDVHRYRASGPGGQKRNKVESAIRLRHRPTGVSAIGEESRSQPENRARALRRLREAIAIAVRSPLELEAIPPSPALRAAVDPSGRLRVNERNPAYGVLLAELLDALEACRGRVSDVGRWLGVSTHHVVQIFEEHPRVWQTVNQLRQRHGERPLTQG